MAPVVSEYGFCRLKNAPVIDGVPMSSEIRIYENDDHLEHLPPSGAIPPQFKIVYGNRWEIFVTPPRAADEVADALGGEVRG